MTLAVCRQPSRRPMCVWQSVAWPVSVPSEKNEFIVV